MLYSGEDKCYFCTTCIADVCTGAGVGERRSAEAGHGVRRRGGSQVFIVQVLFMPAREESAESLTVNFQCVRESGGNRILVSP